MDSPAFTTDLMQTVLNRAKSQAGRRYLPGIRTDFPSLPIQSLIESIDGMVRNDNFWSRLSSFQREMAAARKRNVFTNDGDALPKPLQRYRLRLRRLLTVCLDAVGKALKAKGSFASLDFSNVLKLQSQLEQLSRAVSEYIFARRSELGSRESLQSHRDDHEHAALDSLFRQNNDLYDTLSSFIEFAGSDPVELCNYPFALLIGPAGSGKTHFLCDIAEQRLLTGKPTLIFLARNIPIHNNDLLTSIATAMSCGYTKKRLFSEIRAVSRRSKERVLIFIDAINEADRKIWKRIIGRFLNNNGQPLPIGIVFSCRTPYQDVMLSKKSRSQLVELSHPGFAGIEYRAQEVIFGAYNLPLPEVPLLADEFSNPLFLISFCETLHNSTVRHQHRQIRELSSGQVGMTKILEDFLKIKQKQITKSISTELDKNIFKQTTWLWGRGRNKGVVKDIARLMAERHEKYVLLGELDTIVSNYVKGSQYVKKVRTQLLTEGVLLETIVWNGSRSCDAVLFNYQKFSDHLIVRSVLDNINYHSTAALKKLYKRFKDDSGLLEALILEVSHRAKRELLLLIDEHDVTLQSMRAFISGLYWRSSDSFNKSTNRVVNWVLAQPTLVNDLHEAIVSLATKSSHPYNSEVLHHYLEKYSLVDRDLIWSEYLRHCDRTSAPVKLVNWLLSSNLGKLSTKATENYMRVLAWLLTTTRRRFRDKVTKALVLLGEKHPIQIGEQTIRSLKYNDPYIAERMLAATYGVWMRKLPYITQGHPDSKTLYETAMGLYKAMFLPSSPHGTTHVLARDYARRTILCGLQVKSDLFSKGQIKRITPPFSYGGIRKWGRSQDRDEGKYRDGNAPMHMDFANYTLSRLVRDRQNYDFDHKEYKKVKENIFWRIYKLGYRFDRYASVDAQIASAVYWREQQGSEKVDRYGKKYCWIAYFELYGYRQDIRRLDALELDDSSTRPSDCDIDSSFPDLPHTAPVYKKDYLGNRKVLTPQWIRRAKTPTVDKFLIRDSVYDATGPWILLDGYIRQEDIPTKRDFGLWVHSRLVPHNDISVLLSLPYDREEGAREFATTPHTTYTYAGEVPWADTWPVIIGIGDYLEFEGGWETIPERNKRLVLFRNGKRLSDAESERILDEYMSSAKGDDPTSTVLARLHNEGLKLNLLNTTKRKRQRRRIQVKAENPVHGFLWESYHSDVNGSRNLTLPSRNLCKVLGLRMTIPAWDFIDPMGRKAVIVVKAGKEFGPCQEATYIRQDLLEQYLKATQKYLIWSLSGERRTLYKDDNAEFREPDPKNNIHHYFYRTFFYKDHIPVRLNKKALL